LRRESIPAHALKIRGGFVCEKGLGELREGLGLRE
jgi:hypothetical protein